MEALAKRVTVRAFDTKEITIEQLSNLLWASFGVSRPDGKGQRRLQVTNRKSTFMCF